ncbi:MAG TPA: SDR family NAD(P)-dependent oxidoreductase [bacterium]|nr:SDR family NAD(P)-dependent oxidoreductase [bacterium]
MKSVLITGGTGFFGNAFTEKLLENTEVPRICIYSRDEWKQAQMRDKFNDDQRLRFFIGDVRDKDRLSRAMEDIDVVIAAAALKRIEVGNYAPDEMVKTNIIGAMNTIEAAHQAKVKKVIALSTDKAYQPISPYGQSKALAESLFLNANNIYGEHGPMFSITRYGNVAGSTGSVIPIWNNILHTSDTVPVTDPQCTRFYMTMNEAVDLVRDTIQTMGGGELYIPELPAYRLKDLAEAMGAKMNIIGLPEWEKKHECMEAGNCSLTARLMSVDELKEALKLI